VAHTNISNCAMFGGKIAYLRVSGVFQKLDQDVVRCCRAMETTNALHGVVLDLRFADGEDYAAAAAVADLFVTDERDLLDWGNGMVRSTAKTNALTWPVVVLVNGETAGASEALAALLRETGAGLILGSRTLGAAMTAKEFPMTGGQRLLIASTPVKLADGSTLSSAGLTPDIQVDVADADERTYWNDPYGLKTSSVATNSSGTVTNRVGRRVRTTEADLVRARREGIDLEGELAQPREPEPEVRVIRDTVLSRAVDLLKGLAVVRHTP
jgi:C-terminal processing protease CtpA/Prc